MTNIVIPCSQDSHIVPYSVTVPQDEIGKDGGPSDHVQASCRESRRRMLMHCTASATAGVPSPAWKEAASAALQVVRATAEAWHGSICVRAFGSCRPVPGKAERAGNNERRIVTWTQTKNTTIVYRGFFCDAGCPFCLCSKTRRNNYSFGSKDASVLDLTASQRAQTCSLAARNGRSCNAAVRGSNDCQVCSKSLQSDHGNKGEKKIISCYSALFFWATWLSTLNLEAKSIIETGPRHGGFQKPALL